MNKEPKIALLLTGTVGKIYTNKKSNDWSENVDYRIGQNIINKTF